MGRGDPLRQGRCSIPPESLSSFFPSGSQQPPSAREGQRVFLAQGAGPCHPSHAAGALPLPCAGATDERVSGPSCIRTRARRMGSERQAGVVLQCLPAAVVKRFMLFDRLRKSTVHTPELCDDWVRVVPRKP